MKSSLAGFQNSGIWPFLRNDFSNEDFQVASVVYGQSNEPSVLTAGSNCRLVTMTFGMNLSGYNVK
jgi:hypothetical protein